MTRHSTIAARALLSAIVWVPTASPGQVPPAAGGAVPTPAAREGPTGPPAAAPEGPARKPTAADLAVQVDTTRIRLREIRAVAARGRPRAELEKTIAGAERQVAGLRQERERLDLERLSLHGLEDLAEKVARFDSRVVEWRAALDARTAELSKAEAALDQVQESWRATRENVAPEETPGSLRRQVREVEESIAAARAEVDERLDTLVSLRGRVGAASLVLEDLREAVAAARDSARGRLFRPDSPPLWKPVRDREGGSVREQIRRAWSEDRRGFQQFVAEYGRRVAFHVAVFVALAAGLVVLRRRSRHWEAAEQDDSLKTALRVFSRPLSAALLVSLLLTRAFYPHAPPAIFDAIGLLGLVPLLRLIPRLVYAHLRPAIYSVGGLFALQQLRDLVPPQTMLARWMLLVLSGLALVLALRVQRPADAAARGPGGRFWRVARAAIRLAAAILALTLLANLLGAVVLADLWTTAILASAYVGVAVFAGVLILDVLVTVGLRSRWARVTGMVARHGERIRQRIARTLRVVGVLLWILATLRWFGGLDPLLRGLRVTFGTRLVVGNLDFSLREITAFALSVYAAVLVSRFTRFVLKEDVFPRVELARGVPATLSMLIHYGILALGFLFALSAAGIEVSQFAIVAGALGVGIGFGLQNVVNNFISGLILVFERPVKIGDTIEVGQLVGEVRRIGIRSSTVRTFDGAEVIVPNGNLISSEVINWTLSDRVRRIRLPVGVAYGSDPQRVLELLTEVAATHEDVLRQPRPVALFLAFGESSLDFELRFWTANFDAWPVVQSQVAVAIHAALGRAGIEIPLPQRDLHLRSVEPSAGRMLGRAEERASSLESGGEEH